MTNLCHDSGRCQQGARCAGPHLTGCVCCACSQEIKELRDQVRDLMFYLETQKKIAETSEETRQVGAPSHPQGRLGLPLIPRAGWGSLSFPGQVGAPSHPQGRLGLPLIPRAGWGSLSFPGQVGAPSHPQGRLGLPLIPRAGWGSLSFPGQVGAPSHSQGRLGLPLIPRAGLGM